MGETVEKVILGDGTEIAAAAASDGNGKIWIMIRDADDPCNNVAALIQALCAEGAAERIEYRLNDHEPEVFTGYSEVDTVRMDSDGMCSARLRKEWKDV